MRGYDKTALLFGPYRPPPLKAGNRAHCLLRGCVVVVTSWTDAPIPWPRCRALDSRGGSGLLVDDELARAVRNEAAVAIRHWWRVSHTAVYNWRQALGVGQTDPEGTRRLLLASARAGAAAVKARDFSDEERERCAERAKARNQG